mmetsp:Transcript_64543/g.140521  ORF Transcript_64543/g.140521 Transcript_64543/m.140521 type:complete len:93 (+) Transcript_64543:627-905(+)
MSASSPCVYHISRWTRLALARIDHGGALREFSDVYRCPERMIREMTEKRVPCYLLLHPCSCSSGYRQGARAARRRRAHVPGQGAASECYATF